MIATAILRIVFGWFALLTLPLRSLSDVSLPADLSASISQIGGYFNSVSPYLPITTVLTIFGLFVAIEGYIFLYKIFKWVRRLGG